MSTKHTEVAPGESSASHATFVIERVFEAPVARVFKAFADPQAKLRWFAGPSGQWTELVREFEFRVGGRERVAGRFNETGTVSTFDCRYADIKHDARVVYTYDMYLDERRISVSLSTVELRADGARTRMKYTEQAVFLDGYDDAGSRERGTLGLFERLDASLHEA